MRLTRVVRFLGIQVENYEDVAHKFVSGIYTCDLDGGIWTKAFEYILYSSNSLIFEREKIHTLWTENGGHIRHKVSNDEILLDILKLSLPKYKGEGLVLYRGECRFLHEQNKIGFCWTPERSVAEKFAKGRNAIESGGVLLKAYASAKAVLAEPNQHSSHQMGEFEFTCDPTALENIEVLQYFDKVW